MGVEITAFTPWLEAWSLTPDGQAFEMPQTGSRLLPVRAGGQAAMLKLGRSSDERRGGAVMAWWAGDGAAPVLAHDHTALLMVRAEGRRSLVEIARTDDAGATRTVCAAVTELHQPRPAPPPLPPLEKLFSGLRTAAAREGRFVAPAAMAARLLAEPREPVVLHGDIHHNNILDFGDLGWRAIDPWGYAGERTYDYANILNNPDSDLALAPGRLQRHLEVIAGAAGLEPSRLLQWVYAHAALSAAWSIEDRHDPAVALAVMEIAAAELGI